MERTSFTSTTDHYLSTLFGSEPDFTLAVCQGTNLDVDTGSAPEDLLPAGGLYAWPTADALMEVVSSSASDAAAGVGARTVVIAGLNSLLAPVTEVVTLNGLTAVPTVNQYYRINSFNVASVGTTGVNVGEIVLRATGAGARRFAIPVEYGRGQSGIYTVPAGFTAYGTDLLCTQYEATGAANFCSFRLMTRANGTSTWFNRIFISTATSMPSLVFQPKISFPMPAGTDVLFKVNAVGANNTVATATMSMLLRRV